MEVAISFGDIYVQYYRTSICFVKSYLRNDMAVEDIVSESMINLWQTMKKEQVAHPGALLLAILKNETLNYLKHQAVKQTAMESISAKMLRDLHYRISTLEVFDPKEVFSAEISEIVEKTLQSLPKQTRRIFEMSRYEHLTVKEIAYTLSLNPKSVEYHITQSLKALRTALGDYF
ncbi:MAG: RNA polymerase sigma-70 factor [Tannerellaceae bacterium]|jgi:RNA polymerase sigma-70 factor (ECF subfamily)|nr:RNA polymerase sigma-70 factor [Tannerellaceae bacterium]